MNNWKRRALFAEWAHRWNRRIGRVRVTRDQRENAEFARAWYIHHPDLKPGQAARQIAEEISRLNKTPPPDEIDTIIKWIIDLAPKEMKGRGRPRKK